MTRYLPSMKESILREVIRSILVEMSEEDVKTSKDPIDWIAAAFGDPESWNEDFWRPGDPRGPFLAMKAAAKKFGLKEIGHGSSRTVYDIGNNKIVKIANDKKGLVQNELEDVAGKDPQVDKLLSGVRDAADDFSWVVADKVTALSDDDEAAAESIIGVPWNEVRKILGLKPAEQTDVTTGPKGGHKLRSAKKGTGCLSGQEFLDYLDTFLKRYKGMLPGDLAKTSSWGITSKGCLVLLDYGITKKKFDELY